MLKLERGKEEDSEEEGRKCRREDIEKETGGSFTRQGRRKGRRIRKCNKRT